MTRIRPAAFPDDRDGVLAIDRSYVTDYVYVVDQTDDAIRLLERRVHPPQVKAFPFDDDPAALDGFVAVSEETIVGYAGYVHRQWNRRTDLQHLYVSPRYRGKGIGRALVDAVAAEARRAGTRCVWLETSTHAWPAIRFYRRLGFQLCGLDTSLYDPTVAGDETALFFSRPVAMAE